MAFVIPDKILESLICDSCHKYLSVKPVKVYANRRVRCGRCCRNKNKQSDGVISLYGAIAGKCLFKCINRFDGCREILTYSQVREHEKICFSRIHLCPLCPEPTHIGTFLLIKHFRDFHKDSLLEFPTFILSIPRESSKVYLYQQEDHLFFITVQCHSFLENVRIRLLYIGTHDNAKNIELQFFATGKNKSLNFYVRSKFCSVYSLPCDDYYTFKDLDKTDLVFCKFNIVLKDPKLIKLPDSEEAADTDSVQDLILPSRFQIK